MSNGPTVKLYEFFGVDLPDPNGSGQIVTQCPFCDREGHFYIDAETAQYQCKDSNCAAEGNPYTFMKVFYEKALSETTLHHHRNLSKCRKQFPSSAYVQSRIAYSSVLDKWLIPDRNAKGAITNLSVYGGEGPPYAAPGCNLHLYGLESFKPTGPVFLCEGRWDAMALRWLIRKVSNYPADGYTVLGVPGATSLPKSDLDFLKGRDVYLLYDNDDAGRNGMKVAAKKLDPIVSSLHILAWPENRVPAGCDVEDYIRDTKVEKPETVLSDLLSWCFRYSKGTDPTTPPPEVIRTKVKEVLNDFTETGVHMYPGLVDCLTLTLAVVHSTRLQGEPLWLYAIGDPGRGKSLVLESTLGSRQCVYRTSVGHNSFLSGFAHGGQDNSLLAFLPGKCLIVKDYSNVLSLPHQEQDKLISLLREAYDGRITRSYGNNVYREYPPPDSPFNDCRFSFVAGVTKEIHARSHAGLGERFLKYEIPCTEDDNHRAVLAALDDSWNTHERGLKRQVGVASFLDRQLDLSSLPKTPDWFKERIIALSSFVGLCRSSVSRTRGDLDFTPSPESGTRLAKQLRKLAQSICLVRNIRQADSEVYRLVRKVAWDSAHGWRRDLLLFLYREELRIGTQHISDRSGLSLGTTHRQLHDMRALKIARSRRADEGHGLEWSLDKKVVDIIKSAKLEEME